MAAHDERLAVLVLAGAYLVGSIPFSYLVARWFGVKDVRKVGSGNVGATNVMRSAGKAAGGIAFCLDFAKGALAVFLVHRLTGDVALAARAGLVAVLGHMYPVWLRFAGGKGVATGAGAFVPIAPRAALLALAVFPLVLGVTRYVSVGSIAGALTLAGAAFAFGYPPEVAWMCAAVSALVIWKHRENIRRLAEGRENRVGARKSTPEGAS